ncbi:MAG TPA: thiosulfohydrolase SoxB, partial [Acetobacteraceae bacterium]|nr:thiosulfohydrolase SoxB [Acetobacteraceae bacterium]
MTISRRTLLGTGAAALIAPQIAWSATDPFAVAPKGDVRIIHMTDTHAQAVPVQFREPSENIGIGAAKGRPPHLV